MTLNTRVALAGVLAFAMTLPVWGQTQPVAVLAPPQNVLTLSATAAQEVTKDWLSVVLSTSREGADAQAVQALLKTALDGALAEARRQARPGQLEVRTGSFSLSPRYTTRPNTTPTMSGWQGTAELVIEGRDLAAISQLAGRIATLTVARVGFSLSREAREKVEGDVAAEAITRFRAQADAYARQFGFAGWSLREVQVNTGSDGEPPPGVRARSFGVAMASDAALPVEAGKSTVTATVNGSVQLALR